VENYLSGFSASFLKKVSMPKLDAGRLKTFPNLRLIGYGRDKSCGRSTPDLYRFGCT
jgi:hypothetical protein